MPGCFAKPGKSIRLRAMEFARQITRMLKEDHEQKLQLLSRLDSAARSAVPPVAGDRDTDRLMGDIIGALGQTPEPHFALEEDELFPRLAASGEDDIGALLTEEHRAIEQVGAALVELAARGRAQPLSDEEWASFRRTAMELVTVMTSHIEKEDLALLPMLEEILDEDEDRELALAYSEVR